MTTEQPSTAFDTPVRHLRWPAVETMSAPQPMPKVHVFSRDHPDWLSPVVERLAQLGELSPGWGGPETVPPSVDVVLDCLSRLRIFMPFEAAVPAILPTPNGGIQLEWHSAGWDLEIEFGPDGSGVFWGEDHYQGQQIGGCVDIYEELALAIKSLSDRLGG